MTHQFTDEQIRVTSVEVWDSIPPSGRVRCDVPFSHAASLKILEARAERDEALSRLEIAGGALHHFGTVVSPRLTEERDAALARVRELEASRDVATETAYWANTLELGKAAGREVLYCRRIATLEAELDKTQRAYCWAKNRSDAFEAENAELRGRLNIGGKGLWQASAGEEFPGKESLDKVTKRIATLEAANAELREQNSQFHCVHCYAPAFAANCGAPVCEVHRHWDPDCPHGSANWAFCGKCTAHRVRIAENERLRQWIDGQELHRAGKGASAVLIGYADGYCTAIDAARAAMEGDHTGLFHDTRHKEGPGRAARSVKVPKESEDEA